jgi:WD40 repeat protein
LVAGAALGLALLLGAIVSTWQAFRALNAEKAAKTAQLQERFLRREAENGWERAREKSALARLNQYVGDINLAHQALLAGNYGRAFQLLNRQTPQPGESDLRGFEWRYLWQLCQGDAHVSLPSQDGAVQKITFSPGGEWLAADTREGVTIIEIRTGLSLARLPAEISSVQFSPDGRFLYTGGFPQGGPARLGGVHEVRTWATADWSEKARLEGSFAPMMLSKDGTLLATTGRDNNPQGRRFVPVVQVWDTSRQQVIAELKDAVPLAFSPASNLLAVDTAEGVGLWDTEADEIRVRLANSTNLFPRSGPFRFDYHAGFAADGKRFIAARNTRSDREPFIVSIWDTASGREIGTLPRDESRPEHTARITGLAVSPDSSRVATSSMDHSVRIWDLVNSEHSIAALHGHLNEVWAVTFSPDGQMVATGGKDGAVKLWPLRAIRRLDLIPDVATPLGFMRNSEALVAIDSSATGAVITVDLSTREPRQLMQLEAPAWLRRNLSFARDQGILAEGLTNGRVKLTNLYTRESNYLSVGGDRVGLTLLSPDGSRLLTGGFNQPVELWKLPEGSKISLPLDSQGALFSPGGECLGLFGPSNLVQILDVGSGNVRAKFMLDSAPGFAHAFSADGRILATTRWPEEAEQDVSLWDTFSGKRLGSCSGHKQAIFSVAFSPDGKTLVSGGYDRALKFWNVASCQELLTVTRQLEEDGRLLFAPNGKLLLAGGRGPNQSSGLQVLRAPSFEDIARAQAGKTLSP